MLRSGLLKGYTATGGALPAAGDTFDPSRAKRGKSRQRDCNPHRLLPREKHWTAELAAALPSSVVSGLATSG